MKKTKTNHSRFLRLRYGLFCLGKAMRTKRQDNGAAVISGMSNGKDTFTVPDDAGKELIYDEVLKPLHEIVIEKVLDLSDDLRFPVYLVLPYLVGVLSIHFLGPDPTPIWARALVVILELFVIGLSYRSSDNRGSGVKWGVALLPLFFAVLRALEPLYLGVFPAYGQIETKPLLIARGVMAFLYLVYFAALRVRALQRKRTKV